MKLYFEASDDEQCYTLKWHKQLMKEYGIDRIELRLARRVTGEGFFYCKHFFEVGISGDNCGIQCEEYSPRNGKNGRCRHSGYCYEPTEIKKVLTMRGPTK